MDFENTKSPAESDLLFWRQLMLVAKNQHAIVSQRLRQGGDGLRGNLMPEIQSDDFPPRKGYAEAAASKSEASLCGSSFCAGDAKAAIE